VSVLWLDNRNSVRHLEISRSSLVYSSLLKQHHIQLHFKLVRCNFSFKEHTLHNIKKVFCLQIFEEELDVFACYLSIASTTVIRCQIGIQSRSLRFPDSDPHSADDSICVEKKVVSKEFNPSRNRGSFSEIKTKEAWNPGSADRVINTVPSDDCRVIYSIAYPPIHGPAEVSTMRPYGARVRAYVMGRSYDPLSYLLVTR
jgi:hypothetical protein